MLRVAHFRDRFSPLSETFIYELLLELQRVGLAGRVFARERENERDRPFDVELLRVPADRPFRRWTAAALRIATRDPWRDLRRQLHACLRAWRPDLLHAHFGPEGVIASPVARALGVPLVVSHHGYDLSLLPRQEGWRERYAELWTAAAAVIVVSRRMAAAAERLGCPREKLRVIHVGKDMDLFRYRPPRAPVRRWISVGRLDAKKGHDDALAAIRRARDLGARPSLSIIGEGPARRQLESYLQDSQLDELVTLRGALPYAATREALAGADAFLLCSKTAPDGDQEGLPTVLLEAQAVGLPCVSTRHAGIPEALPEANHWLLATEGDVSGIADRMMRLMSADEDELRSVAEAGRAWVEAEFDLRVEAAKLVELYQEVVSQHVAA